MGKVVAVELADMGMVEIEVVVVPRKDSAEPDMKGMVVVVGD